MAQSRKVLVIIPSVGDVSWRTGCTIRAMKNAGLSVTVKRADQLLNGSSVTFMALDEFRTIPTRIAGDA